MVRYLKLIGFTVFGLAVSVAIFFFLVGISMSFGRAQVHYSCAPNVLLPILILVAMFLGSSVTGFHVGCEIQTLLGCLWITPGFYLSLFLVGEALFHIDRGGMMDAPFIIVLLLVLPLFLSSWAGVGAGRWVQQKRQNREIANDEQGHRE
jgi:hypothetical protein